MAQAAFNIFIHVVITLTCMAVIIGTVAAFKAIKILNDVDKDLNK